MEEKTQEQNNSVEVPDIVIEERREQAKEQVRKAVHRWRQKGAWITCNTCPYPHAFRVESNKRLIGIDEKGMPVIGTS